MICPVCFEYLSRSRTHNLRERLIKFFTHYGPYTCTECGWRGILSSTSFSNHLQVKRMLLDWVLGIVLALGIAWFLIAELQPHYVQPSAASAEMKLFGQ